MGLSTTPFKLFEVFETVNNGVIRRRSLKYDINALADFEQETGMGFGQLFSTKAIFATTRAMLWAGLKHEDKILTIDRAGELIGQWMKLEKVAGVPRNRIDEILIACFAAAKEQGALGDDAEVTGGPDAGNDQLKLLNDPNTIDMPPQTDNRTPGESGSGT